MSCSWADFAIADPELAALVRSRFEGFRHHVLATLDAAGAPRVSGTEVQFFGDHLVLGMMPGARKSADLRRDPRLGLHANPGDGSMDGGDAKLNGVAQRVVDPDELAAYAAAFPPPAEQPDAPPAATAEPSADTAPAFELFRVELSLVVHTAIHPDGDRLLISSWRPGQGRTVVERA